MRPLDGKRALVVGCDGRLGPVWMKALEDAGATVLGVGPADACDLSTVDGCENTIDAAVVNEFTIVVVNSGIDSRPGTVLDLEQMARVNVLGTKRLGDGLCDLWASHRTPGVLIYIASLYGLVAPDLRYYDHRKDGWAKDALYGMTKAAIIQLTRDLAARYGRDGIRVNALAPGGVIDPTDPLTVGDPEFQSKYTARIPLCRMCTPADLGGPLVFLASDMSSFITGHTIPCDGGYLCW